MADAFVARFESLGGLVERWRRTLTSWGGLTRRNEPQTAHSDPMVAWRIAARRELAIVALFSLVVNLFMLTLPIYLFQISDRVLTSRSLDTLMMLSLVALGFILVLAILDILRRQVLGRLAMNLEAILGAPILASIVNNARAGEGGNIRPLRSLQQVRGFISSPVMLLLFDAPLAPLYIGVIFLVHRELGFIVLLSAIALALIAFLNQRVTSGPLSLAGQEAASADAAAESFTRNSQVINAMGMLDDAVSTWGRQQASALSAQSGALDRNFWITGIAKFLRLFTQIAVLGWGAYLALNGFITGGMMIAAAIIAGRALQPLEGMIEGWKSVVQSRAAYARVTATVEALKSDQQKLQLPRPQGQLAVDRVLYLPPGSREPVLNGVSFVVEPGQSVAIVGPSGSGKSTLSRILVGCLNPTAGKVRLDGTELRNWDRRQYGEYTGFLPQEVELFPGTIKQNICRMRDDLPDAAIYEAAQFSGIHDMICQLPNGYETVLERGGAPLSGGQKQRVALARAFFGRPSLVVLDEPNSNLDAQGEKALAETLVRAKKRGVTVVVVTLRPALLSSVDMVVTLRSGRLEAFGPPNELLHRIGLAPGSSKKSARPSNGRAQHGGVAS